MKKQCPKCLYETNEIDWEYCRPCKENDEFIRMTEVSVLNIVKQLATLITVIGLFFIIGRTIWSISEENYRKRLIAPSKFDDQKLVFLNEQKVKDFVRGFNR